jgi:hypothetical protein
MLHQIHKKYYLFLLIKSGMRILKNQQRTSKVDELEYDCSSRHQVQQISRFQGFVFQTEMEPIQEPELSLVNTGFYVYHSSEDHATSVPGKCD